MQTSLINSIKQTPEGREADQILRNCVHCGFCTATCPTYQLLGDELDGPRGRIYLIKQVLEGMPASRRIQTHLDRCLTCRACETTCPSGVAYGRLLDIGRLKVDKDQPRPLHERLKRRLLLEVLAKPKRFALLLKTARWLRPILPKAIRNEIPLQFKPIRLSSSNATNKASRRMLLLDGCVQPAAAPQINHATLRVFDSLGIQLVSPKALGCCGALAHHLQYEDQALDSMKKNVDVWYDALESGAESLVITASGCAVHIKEYGVLMAHIPDYAEKAARVSEATKDLVEILEQEDLTGLAITHPKAIAFHAPCTLQHGQKLAGRVEKLLADLGWQLTSVPDGHICCGSAGTYSILQKGLSQQLRKNKLAYLKSGNPALIATANIGCLMHLQDQDSPPVIHWIELLSDQVKQAL